MASTSSSSTPAAALNLPTPALLVSLTGTPSHPGPLSLLSLSNPSASSPLHSFKPHISSSPHSTSLLPPSSTSDGLLASADESKNLLHLHSLSAHSGGHAHTHTHTHTTTRLIPPQRIACLALSPDGSLLAAGCADGRAYLWDLTRSEGALLASWEPHFRRVSVLRWDARGEALATGGDDGRVCVWALAGVLHPSTPSSSSNGNGQPQPYATLTAHLLPITDVAFAPAAGRFPSHAQLWTASKDGTLKLWDLRARTLLTNFDFSSQQQQQQQQQSAANTPARVASVSCIAPDPTGRFCFAAVEWVGAVGAGAGAAAGGRVYRVDMYRRAGGGESSTTPSYEAVGGGGMESVEHVPQQAAGTRTRTYIDVPSPPTSLALTPSTTHLLIGTASPPTLHFLDVPSLQIIRSLPFSEASPSAGITNLVAFQRPGGGGGGVEKRRVPTQLGRAIRAADGEGADADEDVWMRVPSSSSSSSSSSSPSGAATWCSYDLRSTTFSSSSSSSEDEGLPPTHADTGAETTTPTPAPTPGSGAPDAPRVRALEAQVSSLRAQLLKAGKFNEEMWGVMVRRGLCDEAPRGAGAVVLSGETQGQGQGDAEMEGGEGAEGAEGAEGESKAKGGRTKGAGKSKGKDAVKRKR